MSLTRERRKISKEHKIIRIVGVFLILFSALSVYRTFSRKSVPVKFFNLSGITVQANRQAGILEMELLPKASLNEIANLVAYLGLMSFLATAGYKLALIGVGLLRPIVVKQKDQSS